MKDNTKKTLAIYAKSAWKYKFSATAAYLTVIISVIADIIRPLYFKAFFDVIGSGADHSKIIGSVVYTMSIIIFLEFFDVVCWRIINVCSAFFVSKVIEDLSNICFQYLHKCSYGYFVNNFSGSLVKKVRWFSGAFEDLAYNVICNFVPIIVYVTGATYVLFTVNVWLGAGLLAWIIIFLAINLVFVKYKFKYDFKKAQTETALTGLLSDTITNHNNVKLFNGYEAESKRYAEKTRVFQKIWLFTQNMGEFFFGLQYLSFVVLEAGMYFYAIRLWDKGLFSVGSFVLMQIYIIETIKMVANIGKQIQHFYAKLAEAEEMTILLNTPSEIQDIPHAKDLIVSKGEIQFKDIGFNYSETRTILKNLNMTIKPKESIALIGSSGAGKTTIVKLLFRMHDATSGEILIDGQNIAKVTQESLWRNVSLVSQDPVLFHRSLMENIRYGKPSATDEEVMQAAKLARCHDFIMQTSDKYETFVGERGIKLSGGERQRVAIARAILKNAPILVLDEATSSLDSESERLIQDALSNLIKDKTVIVIAHRLSTVKKMDRIIVIENGNIVEEGTHESLLAGKSGLYAKLWKIQAGGFIK